MLSDADRSFARYRETGAPEALAAVFDATAPGLLLLAIHLTRDEVGAEDLVQHTFVKVIENAAEYDPDRPFLPWASTILANEARQQWRRQQRRAKSGGGDGLRTQRIEELASSVRFDPHRVAADAEALESVVGTIDSLEPQYRAVVRLKVVHGMKPRAIAAALELSPDVARARLSRGLKQLRSRLPEGVSGALVISLGGRGMAQVRASILARSREVREGAAAVTRSSATTGGRFALPVTVPLAVMALVVIAIAGLQTWAGGGDGAGPSGSVPPVDPPQGPVADQGVPQAGGSLVSRRPLDPKADGPGEGAPAGWVLAGTINAESGAPIPGASIAVAAIRGCEVIGMPVVTSDAAGRYRIPLDRMLDLGGLGLLDAAIDIQVTAPGYQPASEILLDTLPRTPVPRWTGDGDLTLRAGPLLRAVLQGPSAEPATGGTLGRVLSSDPDLVTPWMETDTRAREPEQPLDPALLALPVVGPPPYVLELSGTDGFAHVDLAVLPPDGDLGAIRLDPLGQVAGRLVCESGDPIPYTGLRLERTDVQGSLGDSGGHLAGNGRPRWQEGRFVPVHGTRIRTDHAGGFRAIGLAAGVYRVLLDDDHWQPLAQSLATGEPPRDITVPGQALRIRVVDRQGRAIPGMSLRYEGEVAGVTRSGQNSIQDEPGCFDFVLPFGSTWRFTSGHQKVLSDPLHHRVSPREPKTVRTMEVRPSPQEGRLQVTVQAEDGRPIRAFSVEPHHLGTDHFGELISAGDLPDTRLAVGRYALWIGPGDGPAGELVLTSQAFLPSVTEVEIRGGEVTKADVIAKRAALLEVDLPEGAVKGAAEVRVQRQLEGEWHRAGVLRRVGSARAHGPVRWRVTMPFPGGTHMVRLIGPAGIGSPLEVTMVAGQLAVIRLELPR